MASVSVRMRLNVWAALAPGGVWGRSVLDAAEGGQQFTDAEVQACLGWVCRRMKWATARASMQQKT